MSVNKDRVRLLVDALRSGEFTQGSNTLRTEDDSYCCLGVACEVARRNGIGIEWTTDEPDCDCGVCNGEKWSFDGSTGALGDNVAKWFGFIHAGSGVADPVLDTATVGSPISMIRANDDLGWTFSQIADAVEAKFLTEEAAA